MVKGSKYKEDKKRESIISEYLDKNLYGKSEIQLIERIKDIERQKKGIDAILLFNGNEIKVDEKCATNYLKKNLQTYTLEVSTMTSDNKRHLGWLISPSKETEYYLFMWPRAKKTWNENTELKISDISSIEYALVSAKKLLDYLESQDLSIEQIKEDIQDILNDWYDINAIDKSIYPRYTYSTNMPEKPINIILKKETYIWLSDAYGVI